MDKLELKITDYIKLDRAEKVEEIPKGYSHAYSSMTTYKNQAAFMELHISDNTDETMGIDYVLVNYVELVEGNLISKVHYYKVEQVAAVASLLVEIAREKLQENHF